LASWPGALQILHRNATQTAAQPVRGVMKGIVMTLRTLALSALILGIAGALTVIGPAQAAKYSADERFKTWDPDNDGTIDLAETNKAAGAKFDSLDGDNDGTLDRKEMSSTKVNKKTFNKADPDKDGTLTKDEYLTIVKERFQKADPDNDGTVSVEEFKSKAGKALARLLK
jgi:Ca2+-binding EF-hand superfamily protein